MVGRIGLFIGVLLLLAISPAAAHNLPAAEIARLSALVTQAVDGGWSNIALLTASGVALGALHGLEPGHAKTMMSAFIIAIRGTVGQAVLLGVAATVSHTAIVWLLVIPVLLWGGAVDLAVNAPYFQIASAFAVLLVAGWTLFRIRSSAQIEQPTIKDIETPRDAAQVIDTGHGLVRLEISEVDGRPRFVVRGVARSGRLVPFHEDVMVETRRYDGVAESFAFDTRDGAQISVAPVPMPHRFVATLQVVHDDHVHAFPVAFAPGGVPRHIGWAGGEDAHERAHEEQLRQRLASGRPITRWQIVLFGLSGGLLPCPAAVTVLLLCLQLKRAALGGLLVGSFSLGLALTMIAAGALAAVGTRQIGRRWGGFVALAQPAAYASCVLIMAIGVYMLVQGIDALA